MKLGCCYRYGSKRAAARPRPAVPHLDAGSTCTAPKSNLEERAGGRVDRVREGRCAQRGWAGLGRTTEKGTAADLRGHRKEAQARVRTACGKVVLGLIARAGPPTARGRSAPVRVRRRAGSRHVARALASRARRAEGARVAAVVGWRPSRSAESCWPSLGTRWWAWRRAWAWRAACS